MILAATLNQGKGRFDRAWHAPAGGIWLTLVLANTLLPRYTSFFPMAAGVACCEALRATGVEARIKWVNDLQVAGRKIAGILVESHRSPLLAEEFVLIGIGVNINNRSFPEELAASSVAASAILGRQISLRHFALCLLAKLAWNIGLLHYEEAIDLEKGDEVPPSCLLLKAGRGCPTRWAEGCSMGLMSRRTRYMKRWWRILIEMDAWSCGCPGATPLFVNNPEKSSI